MPLDDIEDDDKKKAEPAGEIDGLEESADEVEYEPVQEGEGLTENKDRAGVRPHEDEEKGLKPKLKKKDSEIKALRKDYDELKDKYLRALAEMQNLRKRFDRERTDYLEYALSEFLREVLVVLDSFDRALKASDGADGQSFREGVELIYRQYQDMLKKQGVRPIDLADKKFDPTVQQAVLTEESDDVEEPEVAEELQRGYWHKDRLLRPAMVKVRVPRKREQS
ncbi:MAG: nucleotide exchange factor GrpE [Candidatus Aminicenantes bacterium RBG_19FT_COMBO_59_29]|nr:MAG: nucleotide exchange factor GrpE [Candidatus Aminicenantes bacterium RBG_19FT_COMBO_59_29]